MGSTSGSRNKTDKSPLRSLRSKDSGKGGGAGGTARGEEGLVCAPSFLVELKQLPILKEGLHLSLEDGRVLVAGTEVGSLTARQFAMVRDCREDGFGYHGKVAQHKRGGKNYFYGDFRRFRT